MNIPKVKFVFRNNNSIGFLTLDNKIHYNKNIYNLVLNNDHSIKQLNTKLYFYDNVGNLQYFDLIDNQFYKVDIIPKEVKWPFSDEIFIQFESNDKEFLFKFYLNNGELFQKNEIPKGSRIYFFYPVIIFFSICSTEIQLYNFHENRVKWTYSVKELGRYTDFTGTYEGKFLLPFIECQGVIISEITSPGLISSNVRFIGLDVANGDLLWINEFPNPYRPKIINYKNELLVLGEYYNKYDPHTGNLLGPNFPFKDTIGEYQSLLVTDEYIFTATLMIDIKQYSRKNGEILWTYSLYNGKKKGKGINSINKDNPMQYVESKLYVLDIGNVLHVLDVANEN